MASQKTWSLLLILLLTVLGLGLPQPTYDDYLRFQMFLLQHVDSQRTGGDDSYCTSTMQTREMTRPRCPPFNTFINEDLQTILNICTTPNTKCNNGQMDCHEGIVSVADCELTGSSTHPNCTYRATGMTRKVVIVCDYNTNLPVHLNR